MKATVCLSLLLVILLVTLSAYLRLAHSGIGCADWPACYGQIGELPTDQPGDYQVKMPISVLLLKLVSRCPGQRLCIAWLPACWA